MKIIILYIKAISKKVSWKAKEIYFSQMDLIIKETSKKIVLMAKENFF